MIDVSARRTAFIRHLLVGERVGIIGSLHERRAGEDCAAQIDYVAAGTAYSRSVGGNGTYGGGSVERVEAQAAALGEAVERYCLGLYERSPAPLQRLDEVPCAGCRVEDLQWFLDEQYAEPDFPLTKPTADWRYRWVIGYSPVTRRPTALPASLVYLPYKTQRGEQVTSFQISTGTSCFCSPAEAALRAILELLERDALAICWESHQPFPPVDPASVAAAADFHDRGLPLRFRAFDLTVDHAVPVFLVLALADARPALAIGTAADLIPARALRRAVGEAMTSWRSAAAICRRDAASSQEILRRMTRRSSLVDHSLYYAQPESLRHFEFLLHSGLPPRSIPSFGVWDDLPSSMEDRIEQVVGRLRQAGHDVVLFDVTQPDVSVLGLHVVRAVSTTLVRPTIGLRARHLGNQRIRSVPWQLGYVAYPPSIDDLLAAQNPAP